MKPQPAHSDPLINSSMATAASPGIGNSMKLEKTVSNSKVMDQLASIGDSCLKIKIRIDELADSYFSRSEMSAAEQLVQLSDHSDASCNTASHRGFDADVDDDGQGRGEICSSSRSAAKIKIQEIFGSLDDDEEEEPDSDDNRKWKKYGSLAEIYKRTKPLIDHRKEAIPAGTRLAKKAKYC